MPETRKLSWGRRAKGSLREVVIGVIIVLIGAAIVAKFSIFNLGTAHTSLSDDSPKTLTDEVRRLDIWQSVPTTYAVPELKVSAAQALVASGDVIALTPRLLWAKGAKYEGEPIYLVGRVLDERLLNSRFIPRHEIKLRGYTKNFEAYIATDSAGLAKVETGELVYALGYLAATGREVGGPSAAAYLVTPAGAKAGDAGPISGIENPNAVWTIAQTAAKSEP